MNKELAALERLIPSKSHFNLLIPIGLVSLIFSISYSAYTLSTPDTARWQKLLWFLAASLQLVTVFTQAVGAALQGTHQFFQYFEDTRSESRFLVH